MTDGFMLKMKFKLQDVLVCLRITLDLCITQLGFHRIWPQSFATLHIVFTCNSSLFISRQGTSRQSIGYAFSQINTSTNLTGMLHIAYKCCSVHDCIDPSMIKLEYSLKFFFGNQLLCRMLSCLLCLEYMLKTASAWRWISDIIPYIV